MVPDYDHAQDGASQLQVLDVFFRSTVRRRRLDSQTLRHSQQCVVVVQAEQQLDKLCEPFHSSLRLPKFQIVLRRCTTWSTFSFTFFVFVEKVSDSYFDSFDEVLDAFASTSQLS